jgi:hypothetical protein
MKAATTKKRKNFVVICTSDRLEDRDSWWDSPVGFTDWRSEMLLRFIIIAAVGFEGTFMVFFVVFCFFQPLAALSKFRTGPRRMNPPRPVPL